MSLGKSQGKSERKASGGPRCGGRHWMRGAALLLAAAGIAAGLAACEYPDDVTEPTAAPSRTGRAAPPPPPTADPEAAAAEQRNLDDLGAILGARPEGIVLEGAGGLGGAGVRKSVQALAKGTYTVTAACIGAPTGYISISQDGLRDGRNLNWPSTAGSPRKHRWTSRPVRSRPRPYAAGPDPGPAQ